MGTLRPPLPGYHIVLIARRDPPLPLMQLRAYGLLNEVSVKDLRFTNEETVDFLERNLRFQVERDLAEAIEKKLEGWVTGLRLAAISLSGKKDSAKIVEGLRENTRYVYDYLIEEVLATIPKRYSRFLLSTSILDRFCAPLCEDLLSLTEKTKEKGFTGQAFIDWLEAAHMFVIHLDDKHNWFRYHHLFQEMLQDRLKSTEDPDTVASLHSRAGKWFAENDFIDDALRHSIAGGDVPAAVQLFEQNRMNALSHDRWYVFEKWLSLFPEEIVQTQPALLIARAWLHAERHEFPLVLPILDTIESLIENTRQDKTLLAEMDLLRGDYYSLCENDIPRSLKHLQKALDLVPEQEPFIRGHIELGWALGSQMQGKKDAAVKLLQEGLQTESEASNIRPTRLLAGLTYIHVISAELEEALRFNQQLHNYSLKHDFMFAFSWSVYLQGLIHFYRNEINDAIACFLRLNDFRFRAHGRAVLDGLAGLVLAYEAAGQPEQADRFLQDLYDYVASLD
jgi:LuxR family maltose regulon positive regulatory protein